MEGHMQPAYHEFMTTALEHILMNVKKHCITTTVHHQKRIVTDLISVPYKKLKQLTKY